MELDPKKKKIIENLYYRIQVSKEDDPERANAERLLNRLLNKYGIKLEDLNARIKREFILESKYKQLFLQLAISLFPIHLHKKDIYEFSVYNYRAHRAWHKYDKKLIEINLTSDEYKLITERFEAIKGLWDNTQNDFEKQLEKELAQRRRAFEVQFYQKANLMSPLAEDVDEEEDGKQSDIPIPEGSDYNLADAMRAAAFLDDYVFPQNMIKEEHKLLEN